MKKYSIKLSKKFLKVHPRAGEPTNFKELFLSGEKKHTIRPNIEYWQHIINEVNAGRAYLAIEEWSGSPYNYMRDGSKPVEIARFYKLSGQVFNISNFIDDFGWTINDKHKPYKLKKIAQNDGLNLKDFLNWFLKRNKPSRFKGIIIHFTDLKY
jgi:hypothetical protein